MIQGRIKIWSFTFLFLVFLFNESCILDEFKIEEVNFDEDWGMSIISPMFTADFEFKDLIYDTEPNFSGGNTETSVLRFPNNSTLVIPTEIIFEPASIIDSFEFLINGNYELDEVELEYKVTNGCPFDLNFQMRFFNRYESGYGPPVLPPPFDQAQSNGEGFLPVSTTHRIALNEAQMESFKKSNRIEFTTWFETSDLVNQQNTFLSDYPVKILIVLYGKVKGKDEE